jgi:hypothetical protein
MNPRVTRRDFTKGIGATFAYASIFGLVDWTQEVEPALIHDPMFQETEAAPFSPGVTLVESRVGGGKTLFAVAMAYKAHEMHVPVISNMHLNFPYEPLTLDKLATTEHSFILIDNSFIYFDRRRTREAAVVLTHFFMTHRKLNNQIYLTTHSIEYLDPRVQDILTHHVRTQYDTQTHQLIAHMHDLHADIYQSYALEARNYFPLYNTMERIPPLNEK